MLEITTKGVRMNWADVGRFLVVAGTIILVLGLVFMVSDKIPFGKLGRLPGDLHFGTERFKIHIPIVTSILLSIILTIILNFFSRR